MTSSAKIGQAYEDDSHPEEPVFTVVALATDERIAELDNGQWYELNGPEGFDAKLAAGIIRPLPWPTSGTFNTTTEIKERLEYLRAELRAERISWGELADLQGLASHIEAGDLELLEAAGVPESDPRASSRFCPTCGADIDGNDPHGQGCPNDSDPLGEGV